MKKSLLVFAALVLFITGCNKQAKETLRTEDPPQPFKLEMKVWELKLYHGLDLIKEQQEYFALHPEVRGKPIKADAVVVVWFFTLNFDGTTVSNMPADWKFAGVQNLSSMISLCNWYAGGTSAFTSMTCGDAATSAGTKRGWCTDMSENVYISGTVST